MSAVLNAVRSAYASESIVSVETANARSWFQTFTEALDRGETVRLENLNVLPTLRMVYGTPSRPVRANGTATFLRVEMNGDESVNLTLVAKDEKTWSPDDEPTYLSSVESVAAAAEEAGVSVTEWLATH